MSTLTQTVTWRFQPRPYQMARAQARANGVTRILHVDHRKSGKDLSDLDILVAETQKVVGLYFYLFPELSEARKALWDGRTNDGVPYLDFIPPELYDPKKKNETEMQIPFYNGSILQFVGADRIKGWMGSNPRGVVFSEYSLTNPQAWDYLSPILRVNGGWAIFNFTPRGRNHAWKLYDMARKNPAWFCEKLTIDDTTQHDGVTPILYDSQRPEHAKWIPILGPAADIHQDRLAGMDEAKIQSEFYCSFDGNQKGSVYGEYLQRARADKRVTSFEIQRGLPIMPAFDIGHHDALAIGFYQQVGSTHRLVDYYEAVGKFVDDAAEVLKQKRLDHGYLYEYVNGNILCIGPHDVRHAHFSSRSAEEVGRKCGLHFRVMPKDAISTGLAAGRRLFSHLWIHEKAAERMLDVFASYAYEWDEVTQSFTDKPAHTWASHGADQYRYYAQSISEQPTGRTYTQALSRFDPLADVPEDAAYDFNPVGQA